MRNIFKTYTKLSKLLIIIGVWFCVETAITLYQGLFQEISIQADYAVILGNTVNEDGTLSSRLEARVQKGFELYQQKFVSKVIVSGGFGKEGHFEGTKMAEYLQQKGIPTTDILIDNQGNTTDLTAINTQKMIPIDSKIIVISQYHHIRRTKWIFEKVGFQEVKGVSADFFEWRDIYSIVREFFAIYKYKIRYFHSNFTS